MLSLLFDRTLQVKNKIKSQFTENFNLDSWRTKSKVHAESMRREKEEKKKKKKQKAASVKHLQTSRYKTIRNVPECYFTSQTSLHTRDFLWIAMQEAGGVALHSGCGKKRSIIQKKKGRIHVSITKQGRSGQITSVKRLWNKTLH